MKGRVGRAGKVKEFRRVSKRVPKRMVQVTLPMTSAVDHFCSTANIGLSEKVNSLLVHHFSHDVARFANEP